MLRVHLRCCSHLQVEHNSGISLDNQATRPLPIWLPPLLLFIPWSLSSCQPVSSTDWLACRQVGHELLCRTFVRRWLLAPSPSLLAAFYHQLRMSLEEGSKVRMGGSVEGWVEL